MKGKLNIRLYDKIIILLTCILQFNVGFSQSINYDIEDPDVFENDDIVVYRNPETEEVQLIGVKKITDFTFPNHIIINGTDYPINTISPIRQHVELPECRVVRPDTIIIP